MLKKIVIFLPFFIGIVASDQHQNIYYPDSEDNNSVYSQFLKSVASQDSLPKVVSSTESLMKKTFTQEELEEVPTAKFIKAALLSTVGNISEGEKLLNEACYSPKAPEELKEKCFEKNNFDFVKEDTNGKKSVNEPCCTLLEQ